YLGLNFDSEKKGWWHREWAPAADARFLIGDVNGWNRQSHPLYRIENGVWEIFVPEDECQENSRVKVYVVANSIGRDRLPPYINLVSQSPENHDFCGVVRNLNDRFQWTDQDFDLGSIAHMPLIYE